jgi:tetratricopeptide (TPR) repeat protein
MLSILYASAQSSSGENQTKVSVCASADQALAAGQWETAHGLYTTCLASAPNNFEELSNMGIVLTRLGRMDEAIDSYQKALALSPENAKIEFNLSVALIKAGNYTSAIDHLTHLQRISPDVRYEELLAFCYYHLGYYSLAARFAERVHAAQPDDPSNALILGSAYTRLGMYDKALPLITFALKAAGSAEGHLIMADTLIGLHIYHQAMDELATAAGLQPDLPGLHSSIGMVDVGLDKPESAKQEFSKALSEDAEDYQANYYMGRLKRLDGDIPAAKKYLTIADHLRPNSPEIMFEFASIDVSERRYSDAVPLLEKVIKQEPDHSQAYLLLSVSYQRTGRGAEAQKEGEIFNKMRRQAQERKLVKNTTPNP